MRAGLFPFGVDENPRRSGDGIVANCDGEDDDHASSQSHQSKAIICDDAPADSAGGTSEMIYHAKRIK